MRVQMVVSISGGRGDGSEWPQAGYPLEVSDEEGLALCRGQMAIPLPSLPVPAETAVMPPAAAETPEPPPAAAAAPEPPGRPAVNAPRQAWIDYAVSLGAPAADVAGLTKTDLLARYGPQAGA